MQKKYDFNDILREYNEKHGHEYKAPPEAFNVIIVHVIETGVFYVTYSDKSGNCKDKKSLEDFLYYHVSSYSHHSDFTKIILLKEEEGLNLKIKIWPPNKIRYAYLSANYFIKDKGVLGKSCMRSKEMQKSLNFYVKNNVRIVVVTDHQNKIHARALLWDNVKSTCNKKIFVYLDRVYTGSGTLLPLFNKLADENKWEQYGSVHAGEGKSNLYKNNLDIQKMCHLPYTDTFRYLYYKDNLVSSSSMPSGILSVVKHKDYLSLTHTGNGGYFPTLDPDRTEEVFTGSYISKKDAIFVKRYDGFVLKSNIVNIGGDYYSNRDGNIVETTLDGHIFKIDSINEVITNDTMSKKMAIYSSKYAGYVHKSNIVDIRGEIYHKKDTDIVCLNKTEWYHISQCFINYDKKEVNEELAKPALTPKGNKILVKQSKFFDVDISVDYMRYLTLVWHFTPPKNPLARKGDLIPKKYAIIAYDLAYNAALDSVEYQEVYCKDKTGLIKLVTGEFIVDSRENRGYLKKFNNKYYIERDFNPPNKNQLKFPFMRTKD